jgi:hypothetical protein
MGYPNCGEGILRTPELRLAAIASTMGELLCLRTASIFCLMPHTHRADLHSRSMSAVRHQQVATTWVVVNTR